MVEGPISYEIRDLDITAGNDVAFSHSHNIEHKIWIRVTVGFRKINGKWLTTHEHVSVPFDRMSNMAWIDLRPEV
jgi:ketosteroid isomerase-like protein